MVASVAVALENAIASELVDGCGADAKSMSHFLPGEHAALAQSFEPGLQAIGSTNEHDLLQRKGLTAPVTMPERIETTGNLLVVVGLQQFVDLRISQKPDRDSAKSRTFVSLSRGQFGGGGPRVPGCLHG